MSIHQEIIFQHGIFFGDYFYRKCQSSELSSDLTKRKNAPYPPAPALCEKQKLRFMYSVGRRNERRYDTSRPELHEEVRLFKNAREREKYDNMADLFALIQTLQCLEKAYIKDAVSAREMCLSTRFEERAAFNLVKSSTYRDIPTFMREYYLDCPAALQRIEEGKPITVQDNQGNISKSVADVISLYITLCDKLQMDMRAKDELYTDLKCLTDVLDRMSSLPPDFEGKMKVYFWVKELDKLSAAETLSDDQVRQMSDPDLPGSLGERVLPLVKSSTYRDIPTFMREYYLDCPAALQRIEEGKPITVQDNQGNISKSVADVISLYITLCDKLQMDMRAKDELYTDLKCLTDVLDRMSSLPPDFEGKMKVYFWVKELDKLSAAETLSDDQVRQMMAKPVVKVLVAGSVEGNIKQLCTRINNVNSKSGPFDLVLIPGRVIGDNLESWLALRDGTLRIDVPTYILGPTESTQVPYYSQIPPDGQVADNVIYLGRRGVYTTTSGLSVAYLSGQYSEKGGSAHTYTASDLSVLHAQAGIIHGVDILITSEWPEHILKYVKGPQNAPSGVGEVSKLVNVLKPRYHFVAGPHYERLPYRNHKILHERNQYCTRFISLGCAGNKTKCKWLYAFNITPLKHISDEELRKQPSETTENPYIEMEREEGKVEDRNRQHFYSTPGEKRKMPGSDQPNKRGDSCWFCLKSPNVEKHLVISVGGSMYLALAKGALSADHVMIIPTNHVKCQQFLDDDQQADVEKFKSSLRSLYRTLKKSTAVFFERSLATSHLQIQSVPIARYSVADIKDVFYRKRRFDRELHVLHGRPLSWKDLVPPGCDYFLVEFENQDKMLFLCSSSVRFPLQFGREVLASEGLLNMPRRANWKQCQVSKEQEEHDVKEFRQQFQEFDPFKVDSDSDSD
eukprot:sb/3461846/